MRFKKFINNYIRFVQKILITILLSLLYFIGFGLTYLFLLIFKPSLLISRFKIKDSYWQMAKDYETNLEDSMHQS
jgi:hypothetical protein